MNYIKDLINEHGEDFDIFDHYIDDNVSHVEKYFNFNDGDQCSLFASNGEQVEFMEKRLKDMGYIFSGIDTGREWQEYGQEEVDAFNEVFNNDEDDVPIKSFKDLKEVGHGDNSYNWSYLGPCDFHFHTYRQGKTDQYYLFVSIHGGGDARNNYLRPYIKKVVDPRSDDDMFYEVVDFYSGSLSFDITMKDGSSLWFYSENDSDVPYYDIEDGRYRSANKNPDAQLLIDGNTEPIDDCLAKDFLAYIQANYVKGYNEDMALDQFIDKMESRCTKIAGGSEDDKQRRIFEGILNSQLGMVYGWTMMARGTMMRAFDPSEFNKRYDEWLKGGQKVA